MSLSVVVPSFNHARLLPRAVHAIATQNPTPDEIIIIDDGSRDESPTVIESLQACYREVRPIHHARNLGVVASMNEGLHAATGELVYFAAADDFCLPGLFARAVAALQRHPGAAFYCCRVVLVDPQGGIVGFRPFMAPSPRAAFIDPIRVRSKLVQSDHWCVGPSVIYRTERLLHAGGFDDTMGSFSDGLVVRKLGLESGFFFDTEILACWEIAPESLSARTALSVAENVRLIASAATKVRSSFPADVKHAYADLLSRRLRFNMARLWIVFGAGKIDVCGLADVLQLKGLSRRILQLLGRVPLAPYALLAWMTLLLRPYGVGAFVVGCYRALATRLLETKKLARAIAERRAMNSFDMRPAVSEQAYGTGRDTGLQL